MAAISITPASVVAGDSRIERSRNFSATVTAGQVVRVDTTGAVAVAANDSAANASGYGIALNGGGSGQPAAVQTTGDITIGGTVAVGKPYVLGTAGGIIPVDDIAGAEFTQFVGIGKTATVLTLGTWTTAGVAAAGAVT